ncbi:tRNA (adenosine(37)-N6)-dimethylallyltransferase MiaA [uncultured Gemmiger sp.]|uniref:tRNA (adenosine(37)-N6)-dimethylallyltransferase MiaA n=1 Tax=uncultured Gemmiger sp. TaxID=1623490 RepID=UPI0025D51420|nr:tRNA (adenosine(37)-N6)-dimethylallyltransferase MiaA [uncultured Gemmiger sp.]
MAALSDLPRVVAIGGPTATGKTALSVALAKEFDGEIISADSMQIYKGLDVGTAKVTPEETQGVPHHLVDILDPEQNFSVAEFTARADAAIRDITAREKLPLVVGGTGLYISSLLNGVSFAPQKEDPAFRAALQKRIDGGEGQAVYEELCAVDPDYASTLHPNNTHRVVRALELYHLTGHTMSEQRAASLPAQKPYRSLCICLTCADRAELYRRIDLRVDRMVEGGILPEAEYVWHNRTAFRTAAQAIGYKEFFPYFEGTQTLEQCTDKLKQASRNYAKRQLTWFRRQTDAVWLEIERPDTLRRAGELVRNFLAGEH